MKFNVKSGRVRESLWHEPGLGSGIYFRKKKLLVLFDIFFYMFLTFAELTGSQLEFIPICSLKFPSKVSAISCEIRYQKFQKYIQFLTCKEKAQTADPAMELIGVVKIP